MVNVKLVPRISQVILRDHERVRVFSRADSVGFVERADFVGYCGTDPHPGADSNTAKALVYVGHLVSLQQFVRYLAEAGQGSTRDGKRGAGDEFALIRRRRGGGRGWAGEHPDGKRERGRGNARTIDHLPCGEVLPAPMGMSSAQ